LAAAAAGGLLPAGFKRLSQAVRQATPESRWPQAEEMLKAGAQVVRS
jgi:hypothetical protein